jgi:Transposase DDE domain/Domain of unknown function (DUF4372)
MHAGQTLFSQVMAYIPWKYFSRSVARFNGDDGVRTLDCAGVLRVLVFSQLTYRESLRDIEACLAANHSKLFRMGLKGVPARSTLADALNNRDWRIYEALAMNLIARARPLYANLPINAGIDQTVYALDSTTIDLCLSLFEWAPFRTTKAAVKLHTLLDLRGAIPAFIHISDGKMGDVKVLDRLVFEAGAFYIMDRAYIDFARLYQMHNAGAFFVTRAKRNMVVSRTYSNKTDRATGILYDQTIVLNTEKGRKDYPEKLRRIKFRDAVTKKTLVFLTNNMTLPALTIAMLYKSRWDVELFFKWIKQHLRIQRFLGTTENAVKTQIWCAISTYLLIAIIKKDLHIEASAYKILQILSVSVFEQTQLIQAFRPFEHPQEPPPTAKQLILFDI